jgi:hypothetical protein
LNAEDLGQVLIRSADQQSERATAEHLDRSRADAGLPIPASQIRASVARLVEGGLIE